METVLYDMYNFRDAYRALTEAFLSSDGVPDMLCLFNAAYRNILGDMGDKNAFVDLTPYYADAVWGGLADACTSDGVLSFLPLGITVETLAVSSTLVGDGETLSLTDLYGMADALGAGQALFSDPKAMKTGTAPLTPMRSGISSASPNGRKRNTPTPRSAASIRPTRWTQISRSAPLPCGTIWKTVLSCSCTCP